MWEQLTSLRLHENSDALTNWGAQAPHKLMKAILLILALATAGSAIDKDVYTATAYCLKGRTASGEKVRQGIIAADPRVLPLGTLVHIAGLGEYLVKDTGRLIKGNRLDIWMPTCTQALNYGRRRVKLTVLSKPTRRTK